jgi:hypothetical protein
VGTAGVDQRGGAVADVDQVARVTETLVDELVNPHPTQSPFQVMT